MLLFERLFIDLALLCLAFCDARSIHLQEVFLILSLSLCFSLRFLLPVLFLELFLIFLLGLCFTPLGTLSVLFRKLFPILFLSLGFASPVSSSLAESLQLLIKGLKVYLTLKLYAAFLVSLHVPHQLFLLLSTSRTLLSCARRDQVHSVAGVRVLIFEDFSTRLPGRLVISIFRRATIVGEGILGPAAPIQP